MVESYDPTEVETAILTYWKDHKTREKSKEKNKDGKKFYFLQGPPYTNGKIHIGTAWNECLKDMALRYKRMIGHDVYDRHGYDMHGLPISRKVMEKHDLNFKEDIETFGVEKFVKECMAFSLENAAIMNKDFLKLGIWLDFENAYMPVKNEYIEGVWWLVKRAQEEGRLYKGFRALSWCADCSTALAKHEQEYKSVTDKSIFVKFKIIGTDNEFIIIWTTTPWTIAFNLAVMVNPELEYVKAKVEHEVWILAKGLAAPVISAIATKHLEILEEFKGETLEGLKYEHPWSDEINFIEKTNNPDKLHTVLMSSEYVHLTAGTGVVHTAPGCGPEDYEVGHRNHLPPFNEIDEKGIFKDGMGKFTGKKARTDDKYFIDELENSGALITTTPVEHDYAHCERCHQPIVYRATEQWFFKTEDLKQNMIEANKAVTWVPESGGERFESWLENLRDNSITKQIHWGTPVPIWVNEEDKNDYIVIGSSKDLVELGAIVPENLHKPWIDDVLIERDGKKYRRIPDILDVWIDAGSASWLSLDYPVRKDLMEKYYPADLILEATEQVRLWFNMLMVASIIGLKKPAFKAVYMHGMLLDIAGEKMSKSLGNILSPDAVIEKHGVDTFRYYALANNAGQDMNFSWDEIALRQRNLILLWNIHKFVIDYAQELAVIPTSLSDNLQDLYSVEELYIVSKFNSTLKKVTAAFEAYHLDDIPSLIEELFLELSRTYIQLIREKSGRGTEKEKHTVLYTLHKVLVGILKMFAPVCPLITEQMYLNLRERFGYKEESLHLLSWPEIDERRIKEELEEQVVLAKSIIAAGLSARDQAQLGVRWPLKALYIETEDETSQAAVKRLHGLIKQQVNAKVIVVNENLPEVEYRLEPDKGRLGRAYGGLMPKIIAHLEEVDAESVRNAIKNGKYECNIGGIPVDVLPEYVKIIRDIPDPYKAGAFSKGTVYITTEMDEDLENEGFSREITRRVQALRKKAGLQKHDRIELYIKVNKRLKSVLVEWAATVKEKTGAVKLTVGTTKPDQDYAQFSDEKVKGQEFSVYLVKVK